MERFLSMVEEPNHDIEINEEKLKYFTWQVKIWEYFSTSHQKFLSLLSEEKPTLLKKYYAELESRQLAGFFFFFLLFNFVWLFEIKFQLCGEIVVW